MDILQQEDIVKGLPDATLQMELQMPSGRIPQFLVLSEVQRRADMRQRFAAQEPTPASTVKQQFMAQGLASMAAPLPSVPTGPDPSLPSLPAGDSQQGPVGMGGLGMAAGGKTETKSNFPDYSGDGEITKKDILMGRGVIPMQDGSVARSRDYRIGSNILVAEGKEPSDYPSDYVEAVGRSAAQQFYDLPSDSGLGALVRRPAESPEEVEIINQQFKDFRAGMPSTSEMIERYKLMEEREVNPLTGPTARFDDAAAEVEAIRAGRPDLVEMSEFEKSLLTPGQRAGQELVEAGRGAERTVQELVDPIAPYTEALAGETADFAETVTPSAFSGFKRLIYDPIERNVTRPIANFLTGDGEKITDIAEAMQNFEQGRRAFMTEGISNIGDSSLDVLGAVGDSSLDVLGAGSRMAGRALDDYIPDFLRPSKIAEVMNMDDQQLSQTMFQNMFPEASEAVKTDNKRAKKQATTTESTGTELADGSGTEGSDREITDNFLATTLLGGDQGSQSPLMDQAYSAIEDLKTSQGDVQTNLQGLIAQTQQDAKNRALYAGVMGLAQGIAAGDMAKGLERASDQAGRIMAASETAVAPLRAAQAVAPTENLKAQIDAITSAARADATYRSVGAQLRREEGLDRRKRQDLMIAATRMVDDAMEDGVFTFPTLEETASARAAAAKQIYDELLVMYGDNILPSRTGSNLVPTKDGNLRYVVQ